jgi:hypothetical protein
MSDDETNEPSDIDRLRDAGAEVPHYVKSSLLFLAVPSILLGGGAVADAWVSPIHSVMPAVVGVLKGVGWGLYFRFALASLGGVKHGGFITPIVAMVLAFVGLERGDWGLIMPVLIWLLPVVDFAVMYAEGPDGALGGVLDTVKAAPLLWFGTMFAMFIALLMAGFLLALPMSLFSSSTNPQNVWLADVSGGVLVGPLVHVAVVYRARLFLLIHGDPA